MSLYCDVLRGFVAVLAFDCSCSALLCSLCHHDPPPLEAPGFLPESPGGPDEPVKCGLLLTNDERFQVHLHTHHSSPHTATIISPNQLHPGTLIWLLCSLWTISVGTVSASSQPPARRRDENQVCAEEALQRLFFCYTEGAFVCVLQDQSQAQAEAGLKCWWSVMKIVLRMWKFICDA